jgi:hypothetical protein
VSHTQADNHVQPCPGLAEQLGLTNGIAERLKLTRANPLLVGQAYFLQGIESTLQYTLNISRRLASKISCPGLSLHRGLGLIPCYALPLYPASYSLGQIMPSTRPPVFTVPMACSESLAARPR